MSSPQPDATNLNLQYRTLLILWVALLMSTVIYVFMTFFLARPAAAQNPTLTVALYAMSFLMVVASFVVKSRFVSQSVDLQDMRLVRVGSVIAWAMCEAAALFGLINFFVTQDPYYIVLMAVGFLGILSHMPRRSQLVAANGG
ncbi:MAG TPA: hypothetical protein VGC61_03430 [Pyrinomonadaceae bacterium]|jgi:hypothetical protein